MLTFLILLAAASPCHDVTPAKCIASAEEDYAALRYNQAAARAETLLSADTVAVDVAIRAHFVLARVDAIAGRPARAEEHFVSVLVLDPTRVLAEGASPKLRGPFGRAQARAQAERERLQRESERSTPAAAKTPAAADVPTEKPATSPKPEVTERTADTLEDESEDDSFSPLIPALLGGAAAAVLIALAVGAGTAAAAWFLTRPAECDASLGCVDAP